MIVQQAKDANMELDNDLKTKILEATNKMADEILKIAEPGTYKDIEHLVGCFLDELGLI